jgi:PleD family two-component response regulator
MGQTCSAGIAFWEPLETPEQVLGRADAALYQAKREGRDRAITAGAQVSGAVLVV